VSQASTYVCERCRGEFEPDWSEEEAQLERKTLFPNLEDKNAAVVCHDCFLAIMHGVQ